MGDEIMSFDPTPRDEYERGCLEAVQAFNRWLNSIENSIPATDTSLLILRPLLKTHRRESRRIGP
jgi:hypothetical protein